MLIDLFFFFVEMINEMFFGIFLVIVIVLVIIRFCVCFCKGNVIKFVSKCFVVILYIFVVLGFVFLWVLL